MEKKLKILISRVDNLGDLLLSLPAIELVRESLPEAEITLLAKEAFLDLLHAYLNEKKIKSISSLSGSYNDKWDGFLALFSDLRTSYCAFRKQTPVRVGNFSRFWSVLFFNGGLRQRRSLGEKSEAEYSLDLAKIFIKKLGRKPIEENTPILLPETSSESQKAREAMEMCGVKMGQSFVVLHPGMAGSALNLKASQYEKIILSLRSHLPVLLSVGPSAQDNLIWKELSSKIPNLRKIEGLELSVLKEVFRMSRAVIAPSTGPLHLAHLVGTQAIGIYSPVRSHHPKRWGPQKGMVAAKVLFPQVDCPAKKDCLGQSCRLFNCMEQLDWSSLILKQLGGLT